MSKYTITTLFKEFPFLNKSAIGRMANISPSAVRKYAVGARIPPRSHVKKIEEALKNIGEDLLNIELEH